MGEVATHTRKDPIFFSFLYCFVFKVYFYFYFIKLLVFIIFYVYISFFSRISHICFFRLDKLVAGMCMGEIVRLVLAKLCEHKVRVRIHWRLWVFEKKIIRYRLGPLQWKRIKNSIYDWIFPDKIYFWNFAVSFYQIIIIYCYLLLFSTTIYYYPSTILLVIIY